MPARGRRRSPARTPDPTPHAEPDRRPSPGPDLPWPRSPADALDRTIRNQRYHGWPAWAWLLGWFAAWLPVAWIAEHLTPREWDKPVLVAVGTATLATFFALIRHLDRRTVERIKVGEELRAYPTGRFRPDELVDIRLSPDADEDYAEAKLPVPWCQVAVRGRRGRTIRLVVSAGDGDRLCRWAERQGVPVDDPHRCSDPRAGANPDR